MEFMKDGRREISNNCCKDRAQLQRFAIIDVINTPYLKRTGRTAVIPD